MNLDSVKKALYEYDGKDINLMEVCGTHTAAISDFGIPSLLSPKIHLISGPGCPVCVTVSDYVDRLFDLSLGDNTVVVTFGDMLRVPGSHGSLNDAKSQGGHCYMVYSPLDIIPLAQSQMDKTFVFAAVGFETTTPIYAVLIDKIIHMGIDNIRILTALKTMPAAIDSICSGGTAVDGFIAPGHVAAITGSNAFKPLAAKYNLPFVVSGFKGEELLMSIYALTRLLNQGKVLNMYPTVVSDNGNEKAHRAVAKYFKVCDAAWRGMGVINNSGLCLNDEYMHLDAGSIDLTNDLAQNSGCKCGDVITGKIKPFECPLFGKLCTPTSPVGACMVSHEGSCFNYYLTSRKD